MVKVWDLAKEVEILLSQKKKTKGAVELRRKKELLIKRQRLQVFLAINKSQK
jgi:hypothetical protein